MTAANLPAVMDIQAACYTELVPESQASLEAKRAASPSTCWVAVRDGVVVGYLFALPWTAVGSRRRWMPGPANCPAHRIACICMTCRCRHGPGESGTGRALSKAFMLHADHPPNNLFEVATSSATW